ncbi:Histone acetyltransferase HAC1 [Hondaea fermentalgiana]|uniref:histone acetyltransferase n=1 Tax=Hondaea fermentalgiana TaxID=2315210 RepID=A0A2R5G4G8_9STRA|nr:Histone acetyltransferase HAC1 [Hondaea fermentalgiana]|eukprot:GBG25890.1 Histone acetyltransferase HAC1 [Hondaea fermentalgiana]
MAGRPRQASVQGIVNRNQGYSGLVSAVNILHRDEIKGHIASLVRFSSEIKPNELRGRLTQLLRIQMDLPYAYIFRKPVDPVAMGIPDYFEVIKRPMDLSTIKRQLEVNYYKTMRSFKEDVLLVYNNAILYNPESQDGFGVREIAQEYAQIFIEDYNKLLCRLKAKEASKRSNAEACRLCGGGQYLFEPPVYFCNHCKQKVRRGANFYMSPDNKLAWCSGCYSNFRGQVELDDGAKVEKSALKKKENTEDTEESWVQCNRCCRWYHQICAMFNGRSSVGKASSYFCPICILRHFDETKRDRIPPQISLARGKGLRAKDLPRTKFSDFIESKLAGRILFERKREAKKRGLTLCDVPEPGAFTVRVVLHKDTALVPRGNLARTYKGEPHKYPESFPHRVKCVLLFQSIDGLDVLVFALYTQSFGSEAPAPNARTLYIAYLDSVFYMEPRFLRTPLYQELLLAAIEYEKRRGITKTFIWACPPMAGDDYILYCHPREQKTQKVDMLRAWYWRLLEDARKRGIVCSVDNLYDGYLRRLCSLPGVPNFEGDYWPGLAEQHIMDLEKSGADPKGLAPRAQRAIMRSRTTADGTMLAPPKSKKSRSATKKKSKTKSKSRSRSNTMASTGPAQKRKSEGGGANGDTSTAQPPQFGEGNSLWPPPPPAKWVEMPQQDALTAKIGDCIRQMKEDFFVVHLYHICAECNESMDKTDQLYWLPKAYTEGMGSLDVQKKRYAPPYALCDPCYRKAYEVEHGGSPGHVKMPPTLDEKKKQEAQEAAKEAAKEAKLKSETREGAPASLKRVAGQSETGVKRSKSSSSEDAPAAAAARPGPTAPGSAPPASSLSDAGPKSLVKSEPGTAQNVTVKVEEEKEEGLGGASSTAIPQIHDSATPSTAADGSEGAEDHEMSEKGRVLETEERILPAGQSAKPQNPWVHRPCELDEMALHRAYVERETRDPDPLMDNQFFDNRNQFLSLCQSNNYQFDQLRRAKHSSMMVLYHLHNPDQPAFPRVCSACAQEIKDADWFTCRTCDAYDVCAECHKTVKHEHPLHKRSPESEAKYLADQQARRAQITAYLNLLKHACTCSSPNCSQTKCAQMKVGLDHWNSCRVQTPQVCAQCQNIKKLINLHTLHCREPPGRCPVPRCNRIKQETRRMQAVQADRRIKARMAAKRANSNGSPPPASTPPQVPTV